MSRWPVVGSLADKNVVVFGGGAGIGSAIVGCAAAAGANVTAVDINKEAAEAVAQEEGCAWNHGDVSNQADVKRVFASVVERNVTLDGVVDMVGGWRPELWGPVSGLTDETWSRAASLNLDHAFVVAREAIPLMTSTGGGSLVFVGSISGYQSAPYHAPYGAAKAALSSLCRSLAVESGPDGIRVNIVSPGPIATPRTKSAGPAELERIRQAIPLRRIGEPVDIGATVAYLLTDAARFISGVEIPVDGGSCANYPFPPPDFANRN